MIQAVIKVNGRYFAGFSDELYKTKTTGYGCHGDDQLNKIKLTAKREDAKLLEGQRNIKSAVDSLFLRVQDGVLNLKKIEILKVN